MTDTCAQCGVPLTRANCCIVRAEDADYLCDGCAPLPPRNTELAIQEIKECLEKQLPQGLDNAARHIAACLDEFGRK